MFLLADDSDCITQGFLEKQSCHLKKYRSRWVVLKGNCLHSYKKKAAEKNSHKKATEIIDLKSFHYIETQENENKFSLISSNQKMKRVFIAKCSEDKNKWIKHIKAVTNDIKEITNIKNDIIDIDVNVRGNVRICVCDINDKFVICAPYSNDEKMESIFNEIIKNIKKIYYPIPLKISCIDNGSFIQHSYDIQHLNNVSITKYDRNNIINIGLNIIVAIDKYRHNVQSEFTHITCPYMNKQKLQNDGINPLKCPIYYKMKEMYTFNKTNLKHLNKYNHFIDECSEKPQCRYSEECKSYLRLENGGNRFDDECHMKLYRHPPRTRNIKLAENMASLIINTSYEENHALYEPTEEDEKKYNYNHIDGYLFALINEVKLNGFGVDLCIKCQKKCKCTYNNNNYSILSIVDNKMEHIRHRTMNKPLRRDHMLSLILYTGCDCNYNLCKSQRKNRYNKWKWFDYCLYTAIAKLSNREIGSFSVFSGLNKVKLNVKCVESGYFVTYVSSSWNKQIAKSFMSRNGKNNGMLLKIDKAFKNNRYILCCDVSWISKFPDESEILFARSLDWEQHQFKCVVTDNSNGIQTVLLKKK